MFSLNIHNTIDIPDVRICRNEAAEDSSGWIVIKTINKKYSWDDEDECDHIENEVCIFLQDLEYGYARLMHQLHEGMATHRRESGKSLAHSD